MQPTVITIKVAIERKIEIATYSRNDNVVCLVYFIADNFLCLFIKNGVHNRQYRLLSLTANTRRSLFNHVRLLLRLMSSDRLVKRLLSDASG